MNYQSGVWEVTAILILVRFALSETSWRRGPRLALEAAVEGGKDSYPQSWVDLSEVWCFDGSSSVPEVSDDPLPTPEGH